MRLVTRAEWGAQYAKGSGPIPGPVRGVTVHWEGPAMGDFAHSQCARKVRTIERFHAVTRGWSGIAYTAIVCPHGYVFEGRGPGVRSAANGTSSIGGNDQWYAVCYMSGQGDPFTPEGQAAIVDAVQWLRSTGAGDAVNGHRDHHPTECPGDVIYQWLQTADFSGTTNMEDDVSAQDVWREELGGKDRRASLLLIQAQGAAQRADLATRRLEAAVGALAKALGPTVEAAVQEALKDATVSVDVTVAGGADQ